MTPIDSYVSYAPSQKPGVGCQASPDEKMAFVAPAGAGDPVESAGDQLTFCLEMVHLLKLAVGARDVAHISEFQRERAETDPPLRHRTRQMPKRAADIIDGGSIFWVIAGMIQCRQRIIDITPDRRPDGTACIALILNPAIVLVDCRPVRPFQGWRYLSSDAAPSDIAEGGGSDAQLPMALRLALAELCLL